MTKEEIKYQILRDRLRKVFSKNAKNVARILSHLIKRHKSV